MNKPRFLQIHTLHSYTAALLNRDDTGQAKRLQYGGTSRTRISSQCLKRHWRMAKLDPHSLQNLAGFVDSFRSRELVTKMVVAPLKEKFPEDVIAALDQWFQYVVYSGKDSNKPKKRGEKVKADDKTGRPTLLFGVPELNWLKKEFEKLAQEAAGDADKAFKIGGEWAKEYKDIVEIWRKDNLVKKSINDPSDRIKDDSPGLVAALFGRMVTSDIAANIDAPVYVAHAFTVHAAETEGDYFTAVDDLKKDEDDSGADTIQETELTCGLFYGYVVIDMPELIANCGQNRDLVTRVVDSLVHLIAEVSPGAKKGSTAPFGRADLVLIEAGDRQPRSLATAYRKAIKHDAEEAVAALQAELNRFDETYQTGEKRAHLSLRGELAGVERKSLTELAAWAADYVQDAPDVC